MSSSSITVRQFQSTLPMRGGTQRRPGSSGHTAYFNPPSPCGEGPGKHCIKISIGHISIHPPHAGRDTAPFNAVEIANPFQSTLPMRGGTGLGRVRVRSHRDFNPPSPCGEGRISETAGPLIFPFQSTLPMRGGTLGWCRAQHRATYFNPPSPCGEGHQDANQSDTAGEFQSTLPMRGGTNQNAKGHKGPAISIHPPHAGRDPW